MLIELTNEEEIKKQKEILVLFYAEWCGFCSRFLPIFTETSKQCKTLFGSYDISDEENIMWEKLEIEAVPTVVLFRNGKIIDRTTGGMEKKELELFFRKNKLS